MPGDYDNCMAAQLSLDRKPLRAGMRVGVAVSGGADSVALLRALLPVAREMGLVLHVMHVEHGLRGAESEADAAFVAALAQEHELTLHSTRVDTAARVREQKESVEEAARHLRYAYFRELLAQGTVDAVATAHTRDDQAETVVLKLLRGAWTEGLSGIHPVVACERGQIVRPLLGVGRAEIEAYLRELGQPWREDSTNADTKFARNRVRHELLPEMKKMNPKVGTQLGQMAALARDEEAYWQQELERLMPQLLLPGRAVRGGGRAVSTRPEEGSLGMEQERLRALPVALRRRVLREAARQLGAHLEFADVERVMAMLEPEGARREQLTAQLRAERTPRELRLVREPVGAAAKTARLPAVEIPVPGEVVAEAYGLRVVMKRLREDAGAVSAAVLRTPQAGDRVRMRYTAGKKPLKEVFARLKLDAARKPAWPLVEWQGEIVWMQDVVVEPDPGLPFAIEVTQHP
ncbi:MULTISPECIES: tRNA lysidine(34) synthetase TilS [Acidobacterium]|uniref:tRNA lysidine(34) synthetase TilS n=1 Tax=Acidobacterium TaxID=33973 RepID=UPI000310BAEE|nr:MULTISPECIES: tRNA lysidine(34) synthetase TilS [Acidobacterium]